VSCWHCRCEASIERIVLPHPREAARHTLHSFPVKHFLTNKCREESHAYLRDAYAGKLCKKRDLDLPKRNGVYTPSPDEAAAHFEEAQMIRWDSCNMQAMMHQAYASGSLSTRRPVMIWRCIVCPYHVAALGSIRATELASYEPYKERRIFPLA
jgi:hypothetical protein